ncbi:DUF4892 domain-containing protein [Marinomonas sp. M1K-6]|uniref:DUF4892 domain-containing protein n=1 Tax=Marinomonas profundi TaxID=2726122 RepID=A0A847QUR0_9GAMM|nr:DUF4892 domain-containing protein [Marinomonas profundi]NLQ16268.1 DUF4892 domain-containing protein [Marinomonas profundi]UDV03155.1 DUF4892 domain-containing protein [Marinomonas profundi]
MVKRRVLLLCSLCLLSSLSFASVLSIEPYRDAQLVKSRSQADQGVDVPLSKIQRAGRGWEPESVVRIQGDYISTLYKIDRNALLPDVYSHYETRILNNGYRVLFQCDSRSCGSSNAWANNFFGDYLLYGADQNQYLLVVKNDQDVYRILYINRRGAGDVMVRMDEVKSAEARGSEANITAQMDAQDTPRIRRFINDLSPGQKVIGFVTSRQTNALNAIEAGDQLISTISAGLGDQLKDRVRFINLADLGRESLGVGRISFVYVRP